MPTNLGYFHQNDSITDRIKPVLSAAKVFGLQFLPSNEYFLKKNHVYNFLFTSYTHFVEILIWGSGLFLLMGTVIKLPCGKIIYILRDEGYTFVVLMTTITYIGNLYSIIKRRKISLQYTKNSYKGEDEFLSKMEPYYLASLSLLFLVLLALSILTSLSLYPQMKKDSDEAEAFYCSIIFQIMLTFIDGQMMSEVFFAIVFCIVGRRLIELSRKLIISNCTSNLFLQDVMEKHTELWEFFQQINNQWTMLFPITYIHFVYISCFEAYGVLFIDMDPFLRLCMIFLGLVTFLGTLSVSWALSMMTSLIYDNFISIGKFSSVPLTLEYKFKIICFMKRFGRLPMGISMAGFFFVKRSFVIRAIYGMYSVFSSLVQLTGVMGEKKCLSRIEGSVSKINRTVS